MCRQSYLFSVTLASAIAPALGASSNIDEDSSCLIQLQLNSLGNSSDLSLGDSAILESPYYDGPGMKHVLSALDKSLSEFPPVWDFEAEDAGGLNANVAGLSKLHPMWKPEWYMMNRGQSFLAGAGIFLSGILCCAGGIGGGGIYVTVLMVFGALTVHDAIPLSKVIVFAASTPSLILNLMKKISHTKADGTESEAKSLIDWNLLRIVVPFALIGTLLGVFLNSVLPPRVIIGILCLILIFLTVMICRTGYQQHCQEALEAQKAANEDQSSNTEDSTSPAKDKTDTSSETQAKGNGGDSVALKAAEESNSKMSTMQSKEKPNDPVILNATLLKDKMARQSSSEKNPPDDLANSEIWFSISMLLVIIYCGTYRYYADCCATQGTCHQPFGLAVTFGQMPYLQHTSFIHYSGDLAIVLATMYCTILGGVAMYRIVTKKQVYGSMHNFESIGHSYGIAIVLGYVFMSVTTGCLAGLVGIGGGLIFSPVFIQMAIDPHIAVASSATCVIFTSSSTTFQYLFTDRIIMSLVIMFCIPHLLAAYIGTKAVHYIQDHYGTKKSWITWIVALGVGISCILAIMKFFNKNAAAD